LVVESFARVLSLFLNTLDDALYIKAKFRGNDKGMGVHRQERAWTARISYREAAMSWTEEGAHHMAQMRCLLAMDQLQAWLADYQQKRWPHVSQENWAELPFRDIEPLRKTDPAAWLHAQISILVTAAASSPPVARP
jgi:hypothetical protein